MKSLVYNLNLSESNFNVYAIIITEETVMMDNIIYFAALVSTKKIIVFVPYFATVCRSPPNNICHNKNIFLCGPLGGRK